MRGVETMVEGSEGRAGMDKGTEAGRPMLRHVLFSFALVLAISVVLIGGLAVFAARSQDRIAIDNSIHMTRSVLAAIQRRLADQLVDYSYWDEAVQNLVTTVNPDWADKNVGVYMHGKFGIASSFVLDANDKTVYAMIGGKRRKDNPLRLFSGGLDSLLERTRAQPGSAPPKPASGLLSDGRTIHIVAASVLTTLPGKERNQGPAATGSVLIFTQSLTGRLLGEISENFLLEGLRVLPVDGPVFAASFPLVTPDGSTLGHLTWRVGSPARGMLRWLMPLIAAVFVVFAVIAYIFIRKMQLVTATLVENISEIQAAQEALRNSEEKHRDFAANVAHELRTPLAVLRTQLDNLDDRETAKPLYRDIDHMARLVSQLLAAARLDWIAVEPGDRADLRGICTTVAAHLAPIALEEKKSIEVTGAESPVIIRGNADALEQAVRNLVENAIRYSARQTVVTIDVGNEPSIRVMDRGRGIPSHIKQSMFQRFRRSDRRAGGVGLGLSIVRQSADIHGATVNVEDRPGGGAIFVIRFPKDALMDEPQPVSNPSL